MDIVFDEVRRLTGPSVLWEHPGAIVDVYGKDVSTAPLDSTWSRWTRTVLDELGWVNSVSSSKVFSGGASLVISAPLDVLYTACDIAELIWGCCEAELKGIDIPDWRAQLPAIHESLEDERNPLLRELMAQAEASSALALTDDDEFSLGAGAASQTWPIDDLPDPVTLDFSAFKSVPMAFVTGTNGKSTSVRLAAEIALAAGQSAGLTSTDFIRVGDTILDYGDYSGPGGARMLLRDARTEIAFLEVARGGILRRGLPLDHVDASLITNVASDHLGQYGIDTVEELAQVKFVVSKALDANGVLVLNAENDLVVNEVKRQVALHAPDADLTRSAVEARFNTQLCWFSKDPQNPIIQAHVEAGGRAVTVIDSQLVYSQGADSQTVLNVRRIPMTFNGHAQHNVENALGVVGLCFALGLPISAIREGLKRFASDPKDNPGRGNVYDVQGKRVIVDFAHNAHSMQAVVDMVQEMPAGKRWVMFGHAGDRSDQDLRDLSDAVVQMQPDHYIVCEYEHYLRGRSLGEIPKIVSAHLRNHSVGDQQISITGGPIEGTKLALESASQGDVVLLFVLDERDAVHDYLVSMS